MSSGSLHTYCVRLLDAHRKQKFKRGNEAHLGLSSAFLRSPDLIMCALSVVSHPVKWSESFVKAARIFQAF